MCEDSNKNKPDEDSPNYPFPDPGVEPDPNEQPYHNGEEDHTDTEEEFYD